MIAPVGWLANGEHDARRNPRRLRRGQAGLYKWPDPSMLKSPAFRPEIFNSLWAGEDVNNTLLELLESCLQLFHWFWLVGRLGSQFLIRDALRVQF